MPKTQHKELIVIDRDNLRALMWKHRITQEDVAKKVHPKVTQQAVAKALQIGSRTLLPKIDSVVKNILMGNK